MFLVGRQKHIDVYSKWPVQELNLNQARLLPMSYPGMSNMPQTCFPSENLCTKVFSTRLHTPWFSVFIFAQPLQRKSYEGKTLLGSHNPSAYHKIFWSQHGNDVLIEDFCSETLTPQLSRFEGEFLIQSDCGQHLLPTHARPESSACSSSNITST